MKIIRCAAILLLVACLLGCGPAENQMLENEKEEWTVNTELLEMIKAAAGCSDDRAKAILEVFQQVGMDVPVSVSPVEKKEHLLLVETRDGRKYEVSIDKKFFVYAVRDLEQGKYLYAVYE